MDFDKGGVVMEGGEDGGGGALDPEGFCAGCKGGCGESFRGFFKPLEMKTSSWGGVSGRVRFRGLLCIALFMFLVGDTSRRLDDIA